MGDRDTREDAVRLAMEHAKRNALEQVATYLESVTVVSGMDVTRDEIRTYSAGLVLVVDQQTAMRLDEDDIVATVDLVAQIDTEDVAQAITALRANEDARVQLAALQQDNARLQQELEQANQALASAVTSDQIQLATQQRQEILNRVQSNAMVSQAWTDWVLVTPLMASYSGLGFAQTQALLNVARGLSPGNPHVGVAQQTITAASPPAPPQPPAPGSGSATMPTYSLVPGPTLADQPRTLNEVSPATSGPPQIGNQQTGDRPLPAGERRGQHATRLPPSFPPSGGAVGHPFGARPPSNGATPGSSTGAPSIGSRRLPPTINQLHPPLGQQVPRVPFRLAPPSSPGRQSGAQSSHGGRGGARAGSGSAAGRGR